MGVTGRAAADARLALARAEVADGPETVGSAALSARRTITVEARPVTITGVRIAEIEYPPIGLPRFRRGYAPTSGTPHLDHVSSAFEAQVELILRLAAYEVRALR